MKRKWPAGELILLLASLIWGSSFVAQFLGADDVGCFTYNGVRSLIGAAVLLGTVSLISAFTGVRPDRTEYKRLAAGGAICGALLFVAVNAQQAAIAFTDGSGNKALIGKVAFLTTLYIVLVPILGLFSGKRSGLRIWIAVAIAAAGAYLLTGGSAAGKLTGGDTFAILSALMFALQILAVDRFAAGADCLRLSMVQFTVCGILSMGAAFLTEDVRLSGILSAKWPLLYSGVMSSGIAYTLQMLGQKRCRPQLASLIMSLESVFSALCGWLFLQQKLTLIELGGCALMMAAVLLAQTEPKRTDEQKAEDKA